MPQLDFVNSAEVVRTPRVMQLEGMFDVAPTQRSEQRWSVQLPIEERDWQVGLIVGASGSGKSTLARQAFSESMVEGYNWPADKSVVDGFDAGLGIKEITTALSSVGFSSPPSWLRPFRCLSNGEQFRATLARAILDPKPTVCIDEFTSVVDRQVAQIGSHAVAKAIRRQTGKRFVAVTCHFDVEDWLDPDWIVEMPSGKFAWRSLRRRPAIDLTIRRVHRSAWELFKKHHYLDTSIAVPAKCFVALVADRPAAFASCLHYPHPHGSWWREHRTVCLPDFQGVGIGNVLSEYVGSLMRATGKKYRSTTGNPAMIRHRCRSPVWKMIRKPQLNTKNTRKREFNTSTATSRLTAGFEYVGAANPGDARAFGII